MMQTKNLIQAAANVVKITRLSKGDVFKLVETSSYSDPDIYYGVVIDLLNDGENTFVQVVRYKKGLSAIDAQIKTYQGDKDINIFPATLDEVKEYLGNALKSLEAQVEKKKKELDESIQSLAKAKSFVDGELSNELRSASFKEISQKEYLKLKEANSF